MRELKFRAWSNNAQKWCSRVDYDGAKEEWTGVVEVTDPEEKGKYIGEYVAGPEEALVELYTGLKDKNGKEIYEGDIVDYDDDGECIGVVRYDAPEFYLDADATNWARMFLKGAPHQRVIGNIHENGDLLGDTNVTNKEEE